MKLFCSPIKNYNFPVPTAASTIAAANHSNGNAGGTSDHRSTEKEFISRRRIALERFVNRVGQHPVLRKDSMFVEFLESSRDLPRATSTSALSSASVFRLIGKYYRVTQIKI